MTGISHPLEPPIGQVNKITSCRGMGGQRKIIPEKSLLGNTGPHPAESTYKKQGFLPKGDG